MKKEMLKKIQREMYKSVKFACLSMIKKEWDIFKKAKYPTDYSDNDAYSAMLNRLLENIQVAKKMLDINSAYLEWNDWCKINDELRKIRKEILQSLYCFQ